MTYSPKDYWWKCRDCKERFEHWDVQLEYTFDPKTQKRKRRYIASGTVMAHQASTGHRRYGRKVAPA